MGIQASTKYSSKNKDILKISEISSVNVEEFKFKEVMKKKSILKKKDFYKRFLMLNGAIMISKPFEADEVKNFM